MNNLLKNIFQLIGKTPLLKINFRYKGTLRSIYAKAEWYNLTGNIKDRVAYYILKNAYEENRIKNNDYIAEATSGNTGISFSAIGAYLGHNVTIFMPDWMSSERINLMKSYGADVHLVSAKEGGFMGSIQLTQEYAKKGNVFLPQQFSNEDNVKAHYYLTAPEILQQLNVLNLKPDAVVAGVGTGGTIMGLCRRFKEMYPKCKAYPLEPKTSAAMSLGQKNGKHRIQGIADGFIPSIVKLNELDDIILVDDGDSIIMSKMLSKKLGLGVGISSGANFLGCILAQEKLGSESIVVTTFADDNKKYLSTDYSLDEPMKSDYISKYVELDSVCSYPYPSYNQIL